jgi:hypothetical protein
MLPGAVIKRGPHLNFRCLSRRQPEDLLRIGSGRESLRENACWYSIFRHHLAAMNKKCTSLGGFSPLLGLAQWPACGMLDLN